MKELFKNITVVVGEIYVESTRELTIEDFTLTNQTDVIVTNDESGKGKNLSKTATYKLNPNIREELFDYFKKLQSLKKFDGGNDGGAFWINNNIAEFEIKITKEIDFRGCRAEKNREDKLEIAIKDVVAEHEHATGSILPNKIKNINSIFNGVAIYYNREFTEAMIKVLTDEDVYSSYFSNNEEIKTLEEQYRLTSVALSACIEQRNKVIEKLAERKREVAFSTLKADGWKIGDENNSNVAIPEPVIENVKTAIENGFVKKKPLFQ